MRPHARCGSGSRRGRPGAVGSANSTIFASGTLRSPERTTIAALARRAVARPERLGVLLSGHQDGEELWIVKSVNRPGDTTAVRHGELAGGPRLRAGYRPASAASTFLASDGFTFPDTRTSTRP